MYLVEVMKMTKFEQCLELLDEFGFMDADELMKEVKCSITVANFALQAFKHYMDS